MSGDAGVVLVEKPEVNWADSLLENFDFNGEADRIWKMIGEADEQITREQPFKLVKSDPAAAQDLFAQFIKSAIYYWYFAQADYAGDQCQGFGCHRAK